ncbi:MAG TPA: elongation factor G, partial [Casimicrobiaceae bacterium]|nr:elongation factor G [Casimicrobiaceae bacterium]
MAHFATENIRTVALVGDGAAGKTTLADALLAKAGAIPAQGSVERGTTVSDFDPLEKSYQHSLRASLLHFELQGTRIHLVDTPGYPDFIGQAIGALDAVETAAVVVNASAGVQMITSRMMEWAQKRGLCRLIVINRIDAENVDLPGVLASIQQTFGRECLPINLPAGGGSHVVDCFFNPSGESDFSSVADAHRALVDQVVEVDEELMSLYLEQGEIAPEELHAPFEKALRDGHLVPVCFVSARTGAGVAELLDILVKLAPNPKEGNPPLFYKGEADVAAEYRSAPDPKKHVLAHVFKIVVDPFVGKLGIFRVHQGTITRDTPLFVGDGRKAFKVAHLFMLQGGKYVEVPEAVPGDLAAVAKVDEIVFDCVLHDSHEEDHIHMRPLEFPVPMHGFAITPKRRGDEQRISDVLHKVIAEDPTLVAEHDPLANETVLRGLGELHLRSVFERMAG